MTGAYGCVRIVVAVKAERILILCKTYPSPSAGYAETSCVAGITDSGEMRRLFPVPFRLIEDEQQFRKWQWIYTKLEKARKDHRPESHTIFIDTIECDPVVISTDNNWRDRRRWIQQIPTFETFAAAERARQERGITLALVRPSRVTALDITPVDNPEWTEDEKAKLTQDQMQAQLFEPSKNIRLLRKLPFDFHYRYECKSLDGVSSYRHKIVDWEAGALFWNVRSRHRAKWQEPFREKLELELPRRELLFLMGTLHRFPDQWLIVSLIYPPKQPAESTHQASLF